MRVEIILRHVHELNCRSDVGALSLATRKRKEYGTWSSRERVGNIERYSITIGVFSFQKIVREMGR
jgi:hypothetical protein